MKPLLIPAFIGLMATGTLPALADVIPVQSDADFSSEVAQGSQGGYVLAAFLTQGCDPCDSERAVLSQLAGDEAQLSGVAEVDAVSAIATTTDLKINAVPTFVLYHDGKELVRKIGFTPKDKLESWVEDNIAKGDKAAHAHTLTSDTDPGQGETK